MKRYDDNIEKVKIYFDYKNIFFSVLIIFSSFLLFYFFYKIFSFLIVFFISLLFSLSIYSSVETLKSKFKISHIFSILLVYFFIMLIMALFVYSIVPIFVNQFTSILTIFYEKLNYLQVSISNGKIPILENINSYLDIPYIIEQIKQNLGNIGKFIASSTSFFVSGSVSFLAGFGNILFNIFFIFILSFFMLLEKDQIIRYLNLFLNKKYEKIFSKKRESISNKLSSWFSGMIILSISMFILTYTLLWVIEIFGVSIDYKFSIAMVSGIAEFVPIIGPFITFSLMFIIAITISIKSVIAVFILYILLQFIEGNIMVPKIMNKATGISSFVIISAMSIAGLLFGVIGVLVSIPVSIILDDILNFFKDDE